MRGVGSVCAGVGSVRVWREYWSLHGQGSGPCLEKVVPANLLSLSKLIAIC